MNYWNTYGCGCHEKKAPCRTQPIILPAKTCVVNRYYPVEQPIIVPTHTRIVNNYVPVPRYYPQYTTSEEDRCCGGTEPVNPGQ